MVKYTVVSVVQYTVYNVVQYTVDSVVHYTVYSVQLVYTVLGTNVPNYFVFLLLKSTSHRH